MGYLWGSILNRGIRTVEVRWWMKRENIVLSIVKGKDVLDIGSVGQAREYSFWNMLKGNCKSLMGIDIVESEDPKIIKGDMEREKLGKKFDVIIAGDVIEHVNNQGLFLQNIQRHLREDGTLIITTPNAKWWTVFLKPNKTHTLWHDIHTLSRVLSLNGFCIQKSVYYPGNKKSYPIWARPFIIRHSLVVICKKVRK
jgi:SAM-dependent methyltransferase